jgi:hypothetical protein
MREPAEPHAADACLERLRGRCEGTLLQLVHGAGVGDVARDGDGRVEEDGALDESRLARRELHHEASAEAVADPSGGLGYGLPQVVQVGLDRPGRIPARAPVAAEVERAHAESPGEALLRERAETEAVRVDAVEADDGRRAFRAPDVLVEAHYSLPSRASTSGGSVSRQLPTTPTSACSKMRARSFTLSAAMTPAFREPAMCSKAPRTPTVR